MLGFHARIKQTLKYNKAWPEGLVRVYSFLTLRAYFTTPHEGEHKHSVSMRE